MEAEHGPGGPPGEDPARPLPPLSAFFPELTEEEARCLDGETARICERRARVMALYRTGKTIREIRDALGCSVGTVHHDIHTVLEGYRRLATRGAAEHLADALQRLVARERQVEEDLERSRGEQVETATRSVGDKAHASVRRRQRFGDPRLHAILQGYWDRRCRLFGLMRPGDFAGDGVPPVKLVAGVDPGDLV